jgi:hypothetical protein
MMKKIRQSNKTIRMNWKSVTAITVGVILAALGVLWFLQGADLVHIKPILCFADCDPVVGGSVQWQIQGAIAFVTGVAICSLAFLKKKSK